METFRKTADGKQITPGLEVFVNNVVLGHPPTSHIVKNFHEDETRNIVVFQDAKTTGIDGAKCDHVWVSPARAMLHALTMNEIWNKEDQRC